MTEIVAEISCNHGGKLSNAMLLIDAAARARVDTVKFQCFNPEKIAARRATRQDVLALANGEPLIDLYRRVVTPREWFPYLIGRAELHDLNWFSSVFDPDDVAFLETLDCPRYKISAFEMLDWDIIKAVRETGKPIVISVRPMEGVTIMHATDYEGEEVPLGLSAHGKIIPKLGVPMVEYHLKLEGVDTPDKDFSLVEVELRDAATLIRLRQ